MTREYARTRPPPVGASIAQPAYAVNARACDLPGCQLAMCNGTAFARKPCRWFRTGYEEELGEEELGVKVPAVSMHHPSPLDFKLKSVLIGVELDWLLPVGVALKVPPT